MIVELKEFAGGFSKYLQERRASRLTLTLLARGKKSWRCLDPVTSLGESGWGESGPVTSYSFYSFSAPAEHITLQCKAVQFHPC